MHNDVLPFYAEHNLIAALGTTFYNTVDAFQADLDHYNTQRPHQGYRNMGQRPIDTVNLFVESVNKED